MNTDNMTYFESKAGLATLWAGILTGPILWFANQQANFLLVPWVCRSGQYMVLHLVTLSALLLTAGAGWLAWRSRKKLGHDNSGHPELPFSRTRFMSSVGIMSSALFSWVIIAQGLPNFLISACR